MRTQSTTRNSTVDHITAVIRVYDDAGNVIEMHKQTGEFKEPWSKPRSHHIDGYDQSAFSAAGVSPRP